MFFFNIGRTENIVKQRCTALSRKNSALGAVLMVQGDQNDDHVAGDSVDDDEYYFDEIMNSDSPEPFPSNFAAYGHMLESGPGGHETLTDPGAQIEVADPSIWTPTTDTLNSNETEQNSNMPNLEYLQSQPPESPRRPRLYRSGPSGNFTSEIEESQYSSHEIPNNEHLRWSDGSIGQQFNQYVSSIPDDQFPSAAENVSYSTQLESKYSVTKQEYDPNYNTGSWRSRAIESRIWEK